MGTVLDTITYTYGDTNWRDLLTAYDGTAITYDGIGNPLSGGTWSYAWRNGRELASMTSGDTTWYYIYDADGMRTSRTTDGAEYIYEYIGGQLTHMSYGITTMHFTYDAAGRPATVIHNGTVYYYVTNLQGDVVALLDSTGAQVVGYTYDAWGRLLSTTGSKASTLGLYNPLRYRGYVYDRETGLYYLQSRYYNPTIGRFINADAFTSTGQGLLGNNMFAYCRNNPVRRVDISGATDADCFDEDGKLFSSNDLENRDGNGGGRGKQGGFGFRSFGKLKQFLGSAGKGKHWHHIVEQSQIQKSGFSPEQIHNTSNVVSIDQKVHAKITGYFNSTSYPFTKGLSVRNWLAGQPYAVQYEFGLDVLSQFGVIR